MAIEEYFVGQPVKFNGTFYSDPARTVLTNTATQKLILKSPTEGADIEYTAPTHDGTGLYSQVHVVDAAGDWQYRWETTSPDCVAQGVVTVSERNV